MEYYAHSKNSESEKHPLAKHLHRTAQLSEYFACKDEYKTIFNMAGLLHDLGKYQPEFQYYLENGGRRGSVPHASWGAGYARLCRALEISIAIDGHHKGLPDKSAWKNDTEPYNRREVVEFETIINHFLKDAGIDDQLIKSIHKLSFGSKSQREVFIRYLFR
jgi:CRISPR-associated endonuclease/helicase Cas3